jgi:putative ABC transport system permease protein
LFLLNGKTGQGDATEFSGRQHTDWTDALSDVRFAAYSGGRSLGIFAGRSLTTWSVTPTFFDTIGVQPIMGGFTVEDWVWFRNYTPEMLDQRQPAIISFQLWQRQFNGNPNVIGTAVTTVILQGRLRGFRVAGVLPPDFVFPERVGDLDPEIVTPALVDDRSSERLIVRLPRGTSPASVEARLTAIESARGRVPGSFHLAPLGQALRSHDRRELALVFGGAVALLLLTCGSLAGIFSARSLNRRREVAVRRALGSSNAALLRDVLTEVAILVAAGTALALLATPFLVRTVVGLLPTAMQLIKAPQVDWRVCVAAACMAITAVGCVAWEPARLALGVQALSAATREGACATPRRASVRAVLVSAQVALGCVIVVVGNLFVGSLLAAWGQNTGYVRDHVVAINVQPFVVVSASQASQQLVEVELLLHQVPGITHVARTDMTLLPVVGGSRWKEAYRPDGWRGSTSAIESMEVGREFFDVMGLRLMEGRWPDDAEWTSQSVAIISAKAARLFWPNEGAVGRSLHGSSQSTTDPGHSVTVVGVVSDARYTAIDVEPLGDVYTPTGNNSPSPASLFLVRTSEPAAHVLPRLLNVLDSDARFHAIRSRTLADALAASVRPRTLPAVLFGTFAFMALSILGAGVFGVLAISAQGRTREMGVRIALGATRGRIVRTLITEQGVSVGAGLVVGLLAAGWIVRFLQALLFGLTPYSPAAWLLTVAMVGGMALLGALMPAWKISGVDPMLALRAE